MKLSYLDLITSSDLSSFLGRSMVEVFPGFSTVNSVYKEKLKRIEHSLTTYLQDETLSRPFLYLILGSPGAGKSHLVKSVINSLKGVCQKSITFQSANLSEMSGPKELHGLFNSVVNNSKAGSFTVTFLDEFDVKFEGGSAIKYLINPIYDGQFWDGNEFKKFGRCAFFFAGSYLQDRDTLLKTQKAMSGIDLGKFLLALYLEMQAQDDRDAMRQIRELQEFCHTHQRWRSEADPRTDTIAYLI